MHWLALSSACVALILARLLRAPDRSRRGFGVMCFSMAFLTTIAGVHFATSQMGIARPNDYHPFIAEAKVRAEALDDPPIALFLGASFSRNALNDAQLTEELRAHGLPHLAINLSLEGASLQERQAHLKAYLEATGKIPDVVFLEVAQEFDMDPTYVFRVSKFSDRAIKQFSPEGTYWSVNGLSSGACDGMVSCVKSWGFLGIHTLMNWSGLGLLSTGEQIHDVTPGPSFDPQSTPRETFALTTDEIIAHLSETKETEPGFAATWAQAFRQAQRRFLEETGVRRIAYYYPPVLPAEERSYVASLCEGELSDYPCIAPTDPNLLKALKGNVWFDEKHLLEEGARTYTAWLSEQIIAWEALQ